VLVSAAVIVRSPQHRGDRTLSEVFKELLFYILSCI